MNARQMKKNLKRQINKLKSDNDLMRRIISDSSEMERVYHLWNKPLNVQYTTVKVQEVKAQRSVPKYMADLDDYIDHVKIALASDLFDTIKNSIAYEVSDDRIRPTVAASIFIGRKEQA